MEDEQAVREGREELELGLLVKGRVPGVRSFVVDFLRQQYKSPSAKLLHVAFFITNFLFVCMHVIAKPALVYIPPCLFGAMRISIALPLLCLISLREDRVELSWMDNIRLMIIGVLGVGVAQMVVFVANKLVGAGIIGVLLPLSVVITALISGVVGLESLGLLKIAGVLLAAGGSIGITLLTHTEYHNGNTLGVLLTLCVPLAYSAYLIMMSKFLREKPIPLYAYFRASVYGLLFMLPFAARELSIIKWSDTPYWAWLSLAYCGIIISSGAHVVMSWLIHNSSPVMPAIYTCIQPGLTVLLATTVLHETFHLFTLMCVCVILCGIAMVIYARSGEVKKDEGIKSVGSKKYVSIAAVRVIDTDDTDGTDGTDETDDSHSDNDGRCKLLAVE